MPLFFLHLGFLWLVGFGLLFPSLNFRNCLFLCPCVMPSMGYLSLCPNEYKIINKAWVFKSIVGKELVNYSAPSCVIYTSEVWSHCLSPVELGPCTDRRSHFWLFSWPPRQQASEDTEDVGGRSFPSADEVGS